LDRARIARWVGVSVLLASLLPSAARAAGPTVDAFTLNGVRVNVLLPAGYDPAGSARYPVVYLLHGHGENENTWLESGDVKTVAAADGVIVVMPDGSEGGWYSDWRNGAYAWESFHIGKLIPYIDSHYRTRATREARAIAGLSMGGFGSMHYAARHPDLFVAAGSFSGAVDITDKSPAAEQVICYSNGPDGDDPYAVWGNPVDDAVWWHGNNPTDLAANLGGLSLYIANGNGVPEPDDAPNPTGVAGEAAIEDMARNFDQALTNEGIPHTTQFRGGIHIWKYWKRDLVNWWPRMMKAFGTPPPASFDYRAVEPSFSVWGWSFVADRTRATEFLEIRDASLKGVTLTGSGTTTVTTESFLQPGQSVGVSDGSSSRTVVADRSGRITFTVDLGPAHMEQQYSTPERALELVPGYFQTRTVTFTPAGFLGSGRSLPVAGILAEGRALPATGDGGRGIQVGLGVSLLALAWVTHRRNRRGSAGCVRPCRTTI